MKAGHAVAAVDLGASGGRVVVGLLGEDPLGHGTLWAHDVHRFPHHSGVVDGRLSWDIEGLWSQVVLGLRSAAAFARTRGLPLAAIGIDSWAVDYGLLDGDGTLLAPPVHYRDARGAAGLARVRGRIDDEVLFAATGLQQLDINTVYQLAAERPALLEKAQTLLLIPDLLGHRLTGVLGAERTNASTTGLYDPLSGGWSADVLSALDIPAALLPPIRDTGSISGLLTAAARAAIAGGDRGIAADLAQTLVLNVASHDTASAVAAVPATDERFAYISCGTWSLVGVELDKPVLTPAARRARLTNEVGVDSTIRFLRNVSGLWPLQECLRSWEVEDGSPPDLPALLATAAARGVPEPAGLPDLDSEQFWAPGGMPERIADACRAIGVAPPADRAATVAVVVGSLALAQARALDDVLACSGHEIDTVHLVGGGSRNALLATLTAAATGKPVVTGPAEATALGNITVQARALGLVPDRWAARRLVASATDGGEISG